MDKTDQFFTHTIVGAPVSVRLGEKVRAKVAGAHGLKVNLYSGRYWLTDVWHDWFLLRHDLDKPGTPRFRPGLFRRWLERNALAIALLGLAATLGALLYAAWLSGGA